MTRTTTLGLYAALLGLSGLAYACSAVTTTDAFSGRDTPGTGNSTADAGVGFEPPSASTGPDLAPVDNAVILVHAAKSQAFRLCFKNELDRRPQPDSQVMPDANVVGVEVGGAVRLGPLRGVPGEVLLFEEPLIRAYYPAFGGAGAGPSCMELLASTSLSKLAVPLGTVDTSLATGVHLLVVRGCPGNLPLQNFSVAECGASWTASAGNLTIKEITLAGDRRPSAGTLPAQVINLSQALDGERAGRDLVVGFGNLSDTHASLTTVVKDPVLFPSSGASAPTELTYATDDMAVYESVGFRVSLASTTAPATATTVLDESLARIQKLSSPRDLPSSYYAAASNYALLLLGDPNAKLVDGGADTDDRRNLHFLAVPVIAPKDDAGTDGGGGDTNDAGSAPTP